MQTKILTIRFVLKKIMESIRLSDDTWKRKANDLKILLSIIQYCDDKKEIISLISEWIDRCEKNIKKQGESFFYEKIPCKKWKTLKLREQ